MATVTKFPSTYNFGTGWTGITNAYIANDGLYATVTPAKSAYSYVRYGGFNFDIPAGATINLITVEVKWKVSVNTSIATLKSQVYKGSSASGTALTNTEEPLTDTVQTYTTVGTWSLTSLNLAGEFNVEFNIARGNSQTAFTASLEYVKVTVDYTLPVQRNITIASAGHGTTSPSPSSFQMTDGDTLAVTATADTGYMFSKFIVNGSDVLTNPLSMTVTADTTVTAYFEIDNDLTKTVVLGGSIVDTGTGNYYVPYNTYYHDNRMQYILLASELLACGLSAGIIKAIAFRCGANNPVRNLANFTIRMQATTDTTKTAWYTSGWTTVLEKSTVPYSWISAGAWVTHTFTTPFTWDGSSNLVIDVSRDDTGYTDGGGNYIEGYTGNVRCIGYMADSTATWDYSTATPEQFAYVPQTRIKLTPTATVPVVTLQSETLTKISNVTGKATSTVVFKATTDILEWEARAGGTAHGLGLLVGSGGAVTANTDISFDVDYTELTNGDGDYRINVYARNSVGWNAYE